MKKSVSAAVGVLSVLAGWLLAPAPLPAQVTVTFSNGQLVATGLDTSGASNPTTLTLASGAATQSGIVSGSGAVIKAGAGTLTLSGANTYAGNTTVAGGTLVLQNTTTSPAFSLAAGTILELNVASGTRDNAAATTTFSGAGTLRKTGGGTATWTATSAVFALGAGSLIDVQGGTFVGGSNANENWIGNLSGLSVASGAVFDGDEANVRVDALTGAGTIKSGYPGSGYVSFTFGANNGSGTFSGALANSEGVGNFVKTGTGTQTLTGNSTYTGTLTLNAGTVVLDNTTAGGSNNAHLADASALVLNGGNFIYRGADAVSTNSTEAIGAISGAGNSMFTVAFGGTNSATFTAASFTHADGNGAILVNGAGLGKDTASATSVGRLLLTGAPALTGTTAALATGINSGAKNTRIVPFLVGEATATTGGLGTAGGTANTFVTYHATTGLRPLNPTDEFTQNAITAGNNTRITSSTTATTTAAINALIVAGADLSINNGVTLTDTSGALLFTTTNAIKPSSTTGIFAFGAEGMVTVNSGITGTISAAVGGTSALTKSGAGTLLLSGNNTYTGTTTVSGGTLNFTGASTLSGAIVVPQGTLQVLSGGSIANAAASGIGTLAGVTGSVLVSGSGSQWINTFDIYLGSGGVGNLTVSAGGLVSDTFSLIGQSSAGTGNAIVTGSGSRWTHSQGIVVGNNGPGTLQVLAGGNVTNLDGHIALNAGTSGTALVSGAGSLWRNNSVLYVGERGTGTLTVSAGGNVTSVDGHIGGYATAVGAATVTGNNSTWANSSTLTVGELGQGDLTVGGNGRVTVNGGAGTVTLGQSGVASGILSIGGGYDRLTSLPLTAVLPGTLTATGVTGGSGSGVNLVNFNHNYATIAWYFAPQLSGNLGVQQSAGTTILSGVNTYTGATTVTGGALQFATPASLPNIANLTVNSGGTAAFFVGGSGEFTAGDIAAILAAGGPSAGFKSGSSLSFDTTNATGGGFSYSADIANPNGGANILTLVKRGTGTLTLSGNNTFSGGVVLSPNSRFDEIDHDVHGTSANASRLILGSAGAIGSTGPITFGGAALQFTAANTTDYSTRFNLSGRQLYVFDTNGQNVTFAQGLANSSSEIAKIGAGKLTLSGTNNAHTIRVFGGELALAAGGTLGASGGTVLEVVDGSLSISNGTVVNNFTVIGADGYLAQAFGGDSGSLAYLGTFVGRSASATFDAGTWQTNSLVIGAGGNGAGVSTVSPSTGTFTVNGGTITAYQVDLGGSSFVGNNSLNVGTLNLTQGTINSLNTAHVGFVGTGTVNMSGGTWSQAADLYLGYASGTGTLNLSGGSVSTTANGYIGVEGTGIATVSGGVWTVANLYLGKTDAVGPRHGTLNVSGGTLNTGAISMRNNPANPDAGAVINISAGTLNASGFLYFDGNSVVNLTGGTLATTGNAKIGDGPGGATVNVAGGTWNHSGTNTFLGHESFGTGTLNVSAGTASLGLLRVGREGAINVSGGLLSLPDGFSILDGNPGGILNLTGGTIATTTVSVGSYGTINVSGGALNFSSDVNVTGYASALNLSGSGAVTINSGTGTYNIGRISALNLGGAVGQPAMPAGTLNAAVVSSVSPEEIPSVNFNQTGAYTFAPQMTGLLAVTKAGSGTTTLTAANSYTGTTTVNAGTLQFAQRNSLYNAVTANWTATKLLVNAGGTAAFNVGGTGEFTPSDIALFSALGTASGGFKSGSTLALDTTHAAGGAFTYATAIANPNGGANILGLTKLGAGTLTLTAAHTYTGATTVSGGTLIVNGSIGNSAVTVDSGATLGGGGTLGGLTTFASGAHLAPGNSPGTLTFTNGLTLQTGAIVDFQLGTISDFIRVTGGNLTGPGGTGGVTLNLSNAGGFTAGSYILFNYAGTIGTSSFDAADFSLGSSIPGYTYSLALSGSTLQLTASAIPEPATYALLFGVAALALCLRRHSIVRRRVRPVTPSAAMR